MILQAIPHRLFKAEDPRHQVLRLERDGKEKQVTDVRVDCEDATEQSSSLRTKPQTFSSFRLSFPF